MEQFENILININVEKKKQGKNTLTKMNLFYVLHFRQTKNRNIHRAN